jgi:hypothetical protein
MRANGSPDYMCLRTYLTNGSPEEMYMRSNGSPDYMFLGTNDAQLK